MSLNFLLSWTFLKIEADIIYYETGSGVNSDIHISKPPIQKRYEVKFYNPGKLEMAVDHIKCIRDVCSYQPLCSEWYTCSASTHRGHALCGTRLATMLAEQVYQYKRVAMNILP